LLFVVLSFVYRNPLQQQREEMKKMILVLVLGILLGHFGIVNSCKWSLGMLSSGFHFAGKTVNVAGNFLR